MQEAGDFRLVYLEYVRGPSLCESPRSNGLGYADREVGLGESLLGIGQTDVRENVAAAFLDSNSISNGPSFPSGHDYIQDCQSPSESTTQS